MLNLLGGGTGVGKGRGVRYCYNIHSNSPITNNFSTTVIRLMFVSMVLFFMVVVIAVLAVVIVLALATVLINTPMAEVEVLVEGKGGGICPCFFYYWWRVMRIV